MPVHYADAAFLRLVLHATTACFQGAMNGLILLLRLECKLAKDRRTVAMIVMCLAALKLVGCLLAVRGNTHSISPVSRLVATPGCTPLVRLMYCCSAKLNSAVPSMPPHFAVVFFLAVEMLLPVIAT